MKESYLIWDNETGEWFESYVKGSAEGDVLFTTENIDDARQFPTAELAQDFADEYITDGVVLKWM